MALRSTLDILTNTYGTTRGGERVDEIVLAADHGVVAKVITYGATLARLETPDRQGHPSNVVLGHASLEEYELGTHFFGATVGRYANRIAGGSFSLEGDRYGLACNEETNHLHGGVVGFDKRVWRATPFETEDSVGVRLAYTSLDGEEGYPGTLEAETTYRLMVDGTLHITYSAQTDRPTHVNLTNHSYFNLEGHASGDVLRQELQLESDSFLPVDGRLIPTGDLALVEDTPLDFRHAKPIGQDIARRGTGFDELYDVCMLVRPTASALRPVAQAFAPVSGRHLQLLGTQPAVQLYTGNHLQGIRGTDGAVYEKHQGFALETQHYPDSPNQPDFPSTVLRPDEHYFEEAVYQFSTL